MIYIASPYTSSASGNVSRRLEELYRAQYSALYAAELMAQGETCFAPLAHGHAICAASGFRLHGTAQQWVDVNRPMMAASDTCHVLELRGLEYSQGVREEVHDFQQRELPVLYIPFDERYCASSTMAGLLRPEPAYFDTFRAARRT